MRKNLYVASVLAGVVVGLAACAPAASDGGSDDNDQIRTAEAAPEVQAKLDLLEGDGWQELAPRVEQSAAGRVDVAIPVAKGAAQADVVYTVDDDGGDMVLLRPRDAASAQQLQDSIAAPGHDGDGMSATEVAKLPVTPDATTAATTGATIDAATGCGYLFAGQTLYAGQSLNACKNGYHLDMQSDGNLVLYIGHVATWSSHTNGKGGYRATMQSDGNFVVYTRAGKALWATGHRHAGDDVYLENNGDLEKETCGQVSWSTGTECDSPCVGACKSWSCTYASKVGIHPSCFSSENPYAVYHDETVRTGHTVPGFCGTGTYANYEGDGISCPTTHEVTAFVCGPPEDYKP